MRKYEKKNFVTGIIFLALFLLLTVLVQNVDVRPLGVNGTDIGFSTINCWMHQLTEVNMSLYVITDWMGLIPIFVCVIFALLGLVQAVKRHSVFKVDRDILLLGLYYISIFLCYSLFEIISINYRPILINGIAEASYPSSTTLLVMGIMPTLDEQTFRRTKRKSVCYFIRVFVIVFSAFMVLSRTICGVHWLTDIVGSLLLCRGLFCIYKMSVLICERKKRCL